MQTLTSYVELSSLKKYFTFVLVVSFSGAKTTYVTSRDDVYGSKNIFSYKENKKTGFFNWTAKGMIIYKHLHYGLISH